MARETVGFGEGLTEVWTDSCTDLDNTSITPSVASAVNKSSNTSEIFIQVLLAPLIFLGNGLILVAIRRSSSMKKVTFLFLGHLAVADLVFGTGAFIRFFLIMTDNLDKYPCLLNLGFVISSGGSSFTGTVFLSLDSYFSLKYLISSGRAISLRVAWGMIAGCWLFWTSFALLSVALGAYNPTKQGFCSLAGGYYEGWYLTLLSSIYFGHLLLVIYYQFGTLVITRRHLMQLTPETQICVDGNIQTFAQSSMKRRRLRKLSNLYKLIGIIVGVFVICWTPFMSLLFAVATCTENCSQLKKTSRALGSFLVFSSLMNVVIYAAKSPDFREGFRKILLPSCILGNRVGAGN